MGGAAAAAGGPLTTLRDFLELAACDSASSGGFRSYPRRIPPCDVDRALVEAADDDLRRSPARSLAAIFAPRSPGSLAAISRLSRTISRRLRDGFFRRRRGGSHRRGRDEVDERDSLGLPSPVVSSCSASECADESEADHHHHLLPTSSSSSSESDKTSPSSSSSSNGSLVGTTTTTGEEEEHISKEICGGGGDGDPAAVGETMDHQDKQQLSPVSVMDFPFDDDGEEEEEEERSDAGTCECSPAASFQLQRSKATQQQHKIRRFEGLAQVVSAVDLDARFVTASDDTRSSCSTAATADHGAAAGAAPPPSDHEHQSAVVGEEDERGVLLLLPDHEHYRHLLARLLKDTAAVSAADERLLGDFFAEAVQHRLRASPARPAVSRRRLGDDHEEYTAALVRAAREWVQGGGTQWGLGDVLFSGEAALVDMEWPRRWMCVAGKEDQRDVGVAVEGLVMDALLAELVGDMLVCTGV